MDLSWLDLVIVFLALGFLMHGFNVGLLRSAFPVAGVIFGLLAAAGTYSRLGNYLLAHFSIQPNTADIVSFLVVFIVVIILFSLLEHIASLLVRFRLLRIVDRLTGALFGIGLGLVLSGVALLFITSFAPSILPGQNVVEDSFLGSKTLRMVESIYTAASYSLPISLPNLYDQPEYQQTEPRAEEYGVNVSLLDFQEFDGAKCVACGGAVVYQGVLATDAGYMSPKFICAECARTSDGCQTFEGHHYLYDQCPAVKAREGYRIDCGMWPNNNYIRVTETCPVCGESGLGH